MSERHTEALAHLNYGLHDGGGFVLLTGEVGYGKTNSLPLSAAAVAVWISDLGSGDQPHAHRAGAAGFHL